MSIYGRNHSASAASPNGRAGTVRGQRGHKEGTYLSLAGEEQEGEAWHSLADA
jgi:hypothetical protein